MKTLTQLLAGALSCLLFVLLARRLGRGRELFVYAAALAAAALVYVGFAAFGGASARWVVVEAAGLVLFSAPALAGARGGAWALAAGWASHAAWDALLHKAPGVGFVPEWYPFVCVGFDLFLAAYVAAVAAEGRLAGYGPQD